MIIFGDGLNTTAQKLGYSVSELVVGSYIQVPNWTEELGDIYDQYMIHEISQTEEGLVGKVGYICHTRT